MKTSKEKTTATVKREVQKLQDMEAQLLMIENSLSKNKEFQQFVKLQKEVNNKAAEVWSEVESQMVEHDIKSIEADWVKLTIVEKPKIEIIGEIAKAFTKRVPDTKKINAHIKETGETPEGVKRSTTKYLRKTFRSAVS